MQEGDVQIKGYPVRLPLDVLLVLHREPRGLHGARQDHHAAQGPHRQRDQHALPGERRAGRGDHAAGGVDRSAAAAPVRVPPTSCAEVVERIAFEARTRQADRQAVAASPSACRSRVLENVGLERRAPRAAVAASATSCRASRDVYAALPAITGKIELEYEGELVGRRGDRARADPRARPTRRSRRTRRRREHRRDRDVVRRRRRAAGDRRGAVAARCVAALRDACRGCSRSSPSTGLADDGDDALVAGGVRARARGARRAQEDLRAPTTGRYAPRRGARAPAAAPRSSGACASTAYKQVNYAAAHSRTRSTLQSTCSTSSPTSSCSPASLAAGSASPWGDPRRGRGPLARRAAQAILDALMESGQFTPEMLEALRGDGDDDARRRAASSPSCSTRSSSG